MITSIVTAPRVVALCLATALCSSLMAQTQTTPRPGNPSSATPRTDVAIGSVKLSRSDRTFLEKAAQSGMKEVAVSRAVATKLTNPGLRELAQMMITEHSAANSELMALAARKGVALPADDNGMKEGNRWAKNDKDVDDEYLEEMKDDHQDAIDIFQAGAKTEDAEIAAFARKTLPKLQAHLEHIKSLKKMN
jgi:putative membrane protein